MTGEKHRGKKACDKCRKNTMSNEAETCVSGQAGCLPH